MCSTEGTATSPNAATGGGSSGNNTLLPYPLGALKQLNDAAAAAGGAGGSVAVAPNLLQPLDHYRLQLYNYAMAERLRFAHHYPGAAPGGMPLCPGYPPYNPRQLAFSMSLFHHRALQPEEPKPQHSYIGLIAMAILSSPESKLVLSDIYQYILDNYPYFRSRGPGWRNSIRHNLSLNDCFIKAGRSANGKGHYWAIHPANVEDFKKGDFRRRKAQRKVRKHMGLAVDEEGGDSPSPPPVPSSPPPVPTVVPPVSALPGLCWATPTASQQAAAGHHTTSIFPNLHCSSITGSTARKRQFDVASLLAPDDEEDFGSRKTPRRLHPAAAALMGQSYLSSGEEDAVEEDIDVVTSDQDNNQEAAAANKESEAASEGAVSGMLQPAPAMVWSPQHPHPLQVMFPGSSLVEHHQLVSRYYEQLAAVQQHQHRRMLQQQQQQTTATENTDS